MPRIVIAGASAASRAQLSRLLASSGFDIFRSCASGGELRRALTACEDGIIVMAGVMADCLPDALAADFGGSFQILLIGKPECLARCESPRIFRLSYPCPGSAVTGAVEMLSQLHTMGLPKRPDGEKALIDRAKAVLMRQRGISEAAAHRCMQQYAMRHGVRMIDCARLLLDDAAMPPSCTPP